MELAKEFGVAQALISHALARLEQMDIIERRSGEIKVKLESVHLVRESPVYRPWRNQLKLMSAQRMNALRTDQAYSFSVVFSADKNVAQILQRKFMEFLKEAESDVAAAKSKDVYQMSFDIFPWTDD